MRVHVCAVQMTLHRADVLEAYLNGQDNIQKATVYERTGDVVLTYRGSRKDAAALLAAYRFDNEELEVLVTSHDSRKINQEYQEKMVNLVAGRVFRKVFLPAPIAAAYTVWRSIAFVWKGIRCLLHRKLEVEVLDALSITASLLRGDYSTAGSVMFLLTVGSLLEEWTRKKSLDDLARSMALNVDKVWVRTPQGEVLVPLTRVHAGDEVVGIFLSHELSGTCQCARLAADMANVDNVLFVDSENVCLGESLLVRLAVQLRDAGKTAGQIAATLEHAKEHLHLVAVIDDLKYLRKGGRLPAAVAVAGGMLGIKPLITIKEGKVVMAGKARGLPGAYVALFKKIEELGGISTCADALAGYTLAPREVQPIQTYLQENLGRSEARVRQIGCVIGTHAGPGAFGLAFLDEGFTF